MEKIVKIKKKKNKVIIIIKKGGRKIEKIVKDLHGNYISRKNYLTHESVVYGGLTPMEIDYIMNGT